jgi:hypothetical protein
MALSFLGGVCRRQNGFCIRHGVCYVYTDTNTLYMEQGPRDVQPVAITERSHNV